MGKLDDMRRLREEQHEAKQRAHDARKKAEGQKPVVATDEPAPKREIVVETKPSKPARKSADGDEKGECPSCKKQKPLVNGVLANHQKGFGKMCPGSRKAPA